MAFVPAPSDPRDRHGRRRSLAAAEAAAWPVPPSPRPAPATTSSAGSSPTTASSAAPEPSVATVVGPGSDAAPVERALKELWKGTGNPAGPKDCTELPAVDPDGQVWTAPCWADGFWVFDKDGNFLEPWGTRARVPANPTSRCRRPTTLSAASRSPLTARSTRTTPETCASSTSMRSGRSSAPGVCSATATASSPSPPTSPLGRSAIFMWPMAREATCRCSSGWHVQAFDRKWYRSARPFRLVRARWQGQCRWRRTERLHRQIRPRWAAAASNRLHRDRRRHDRHGHRSRRQHLRELYQHEGAVRARPRRVPPEGTLKHSWPGIGDYITIVDDGTAILATSTRPGVREEIRAPEGLS